MGVQRTDERKKVGFGENMISLKLVFLKKTWLVWYGSSMGDTQEWRQKWKTCSWKKISPIDFFQKKSFDLVMSGSTEVQREERKNSIWRTFFSTEKFSL